MVVTVTREKLLYINASPADFCPVRTQFLASPFFFKKSTRQSLEYMPHSEVKKILWLKAWYTTLYISSWNCASRGILVAPVVGPCPEDRRDVRKNFWVRKDRVTYSRILSRGNYARLPWRRDSAYLINKWAMNPGTSILRELTCDEYALGNKNMYYRSHRVPRVAIQPYSSFLIQIYHLSPLMMYLMLVPVGVCPKVMDILVKPLVRLRIGTFEFMSWLRKALSMFGKDSISLNGNIYLWMRNLRRS